MRQLFYVSDSLVGRNSSELDRILVRSQSNNTIDGITGLLWTDGNRFAQVLEGEDGAIDNVMRRIFADPRHSNIRVLEGKGCDQRQYGAWAMVQPAAESLAEVYERRVTTFLTRSSGTISQAFREVISGALLI